MFHYVFHSTLQKCKHNCQKNKIQIYTVIFWNNKSININIKTRHVLCDEQGGYSSFYWLKMIKQLKKKVV